MNPELDKARFTIRYQHNATGSPLDLYPRISIPIGLDERSPFGDFHRVSGSDNRSIAQMLDPGEPTLL